MTQEEKDYITAVNNRCSISRPDKCTNCKVVSTSGNRVTSEEFETLWQDGRR